MAKVLTLANAWESLTTVQRSQVKMWHVEALCKVFKRKGKSANEAKFLCMLCGNFSPSEVRRGAGLVYAKKGRA